ncbi:hypothetical protein LCM20_12425 [Halobacillus litoralis]|uniref:hypothetical protein n=1 Tax=Halobacillus litoralis TaxID=45668 RepID=UPI001CD348F2|nr:hypothetical protein [Halobacillus litoralis]MCA0971402.1 hypothetical protein [Halobacillus litoralis]
MFSNLQAAMWMIGVLLVVMMLVMTVTLVIKARKVWFKKKEASILAEYNDYLDYVQLQLDEEERLRTPLKPLGSLEKKVLQKELLQWVDRLDGMHRRKLLQLCDDLGLIEFNMQRLKSPFSLTKIDAAYYLGALRTGKATPNLFSLLYKTKFDSSVYILARSIVQTAKDPSEVSEALRFLIDNGKQQAQLIADISKETPLDLRELYTRFLEESNPSYIEVGLIGLQDQVELDLSERVHRFMESENRDIRQAAANLLIHSMDLTDEDVEYYLQFPDWEVRKLFAEWIGSAELIQYTNLLRKSLNDTNWIVARTSGQSLIKLGEGGFEVLCEVAGRLDQHHGTAIAKELVEEELKHSIDQAHSLEDITTYNQKVFVYQKFIGENASLTRVM